MTPPWNRDDEIEPRELEAALRFVYALHMRTADSADRIEALLMAVVKALVDGGIVDAARLERSVQAPVSQPASDQDRAVVALGMLRDKYAEQSPPDLDCRTLLPLCKARCCRLTFPLTLQDLEEGRISWSYARPFHILHQPGGGCVHQDGATGHCSVYEQRPAICRSYDCREDERIWIDFERRIPAPMEALTPAARGSASGEMNAGGELKT